MFAGPYIQSIYRAGCLHHFKQPTTTTFQQAQRHPNQHTRVQSIIEMSSQIQGYKITNNIVSLDFNGSYTHFVAGGQEFIKIFSLSTQDKCWFDLRKSITKYRNISVTKTCVKELAWNKHGSDLFAIGTTLGYVLVYDANNYGSVMQFKGHQSIVYNVEWNTNSTKELVSASFDNYILQWDIREKQGIVKRYEFTENTHIRQVKFSPSNPYHLAAQSSTKLEIIDIRQPNKTFWSYEINDSELNGNAVEWDPKNPDRIASAISKKILIFDLKERAKEPLDELAHYSLIKSFHWMRSKENHFSILGQSPEKNIFVYDLEDKNRIAYMYGGHNRSVECWKMNGNQSLLLSASNSKEKAKPGQPATQKGHLVVQHTDNYFDPNESKFNYPITFDKNSNLAFCLNSEEQKRSFGSGIASFGTSHNLGRKKSGRTKQYNPMVVGLDEYVGSEITSEVSFPSIREELIYLYENYIIDGKSEEIVEHNSRVALQIGKPTCAEFWRVLFVIAFPVQAEEHSIESIYQQRLELDIEIIDNRVTLFNRDQLQRQPRRLSVLDLIQDLVDDNQLQTAMIGTLALIHKQPELIPFDFLYKLSDPYIALLHNFQLYSVANDTISMTRDKTILDSTSKNVQFKISCGWCKESMTKGRCKCTLLCVLCKESLGERMVIWCKYCGHGGHAVEYRKWFAEDKKKYCPHGCGHTCFTPDDFQ